jgi:uncharacterized protein involved in type VI secretion and phage assembly
MNLLEPTAVPSRLIHGVVIGIVTNNQDPDGLGRVRLCFPWLSPDDESAWARVAAPMAGKDRGCYFLPEVEDEVLVAFEHGDPSFPYVLGCLWNGKDSPPASNGDGKNAVRVIKSKSGHVIRLTDSSGGEKIEIIDQSGNNSVVIDSASNAITIKASGKITLDGQDIEIKGKTSVKLTAAKIDLN